MFMSVVDELRQNAVFPEVAGRRVLLTGVSEGFGVDVARSLADHYTRLVVQTPELTPEMTELSALLARSAADLQIFEQAFADGDDAVRFTQGPAQKAFGGLETVINLIRIDNGDLKGRLDLDSIEDLIAEKLVAPTMIGRIAANRMRLTLTGGLVLNVIATPRPDNPHQATLCDLLRATLATVTRREAEQWADHGIRMNAVGPCTLVDLVSGTRCLSGEPDVAALALYLSSERGSGLNGLTFDAKDL